jgi:hypothetical protein
MPCVKSRVVFVRVTPEEHERLACFAADRNVSMAAAARALIGERLDHPLLRPRSVRPTSVSPFPGR